jgi:hypothetical protein
MRVTKKIVRWFALPIAAVLSSLSIAAPLGEDPTFQQVLPLYTAPLADNTAAAEGKQTEQKQRFIRLQTGAYGKPEDFTAKAHLVFKTDKRPMVAEARAFTLESPVATRASEWRNEGALYIWRGDMDARATPLTLPLAPENGAKPLQLGEFDEFRLDYTSSPGVPPCVPQIKFQVSILPYSGDSKVLQNMGASTDGGDNSLKSLATIDATRADWKERGNGYLVRRVLGLAPDENWRYVQSQKQGVMQRRLHVQLDHVEVLDIAVAPGTIVERINLMVGLNDNYRAGELVEFADLQNIALPDGRQGIRLNLREALEKRFAKEWAENTMEPGKHHFYLQEIFIFIPGEARAISEKKPVQSLVFLGAVMGEGIQKSEFMLQRLTLASNVVGINAYRQRMVVDMRKLAEKGETNLKSAELSLLPPVGAASCAIRIEGMQAVSTYSGTMPAFARMVEDFSRRWGGVFNVTSPQYDQVESPGIVGYFPFSTLTQDARQDGAVEVVMKLGANNQLQSQPVPAQGQLLPYRIVGLNGKEIAPDKTRLISPVGAALRAEGAMPRGTTENDLLVLEGRSRALEISWPLTAHINDKTWFYFGVGEGVEQTGSITLSLGLADGSVVQRQVVPNQPLRLVTGEAEVRNVRLRILPAVTPYRFKLREMALFAPTAASYAQAFTHPLPTPYTVIPKPVLQSAHASVLEVQPGRVAGLASNEPLRFSTPLDPALDWVRGVRLNYRLPPTYSDGNGCPLTLQFNWVNGKTERQVCFEKPDGALFIPMASWLGATDRPQNLGALKSIDWVLRSATGGDRGVLESFDLQFSVDGWAMVSAADHLRLSPLFNAGRYPVFADAEHSKEVATRRYAKNIWLPLEDKALPRMLAAGGQIQPAEHGLFTLDQVVAEPRQPMSWDRWRELTETPTLVAPPRGPKWLMWVSTMLLAWATWKKGWWSPGKAWTLGKGSVKVLIRILRWVLGVAGRWGWHALPNINLAIGVLALGPGLWLAGRYGSSFAGIMLLAASVLVAWGAYCHWREQKGQHRPESNSGMRTRFGALAVALGCAIWSLGQYKLSAEALWGFLPLLGAIYALVPALYRLGRQLVLNYRGYVLLGGWLALTLALYGGGLLVKVGSGGNYFFTFGALALVFALRAWLLAIEPRFRGLFPVAAERVYAGAGSLYFSVALVMLVATAAVLSVKLQPIAEQLAIVAYYCLVIGTVQAAWALRKGDKKTVDIPNRE